MRSLLCVILILIACILSGYDDATGYSTPTFQGRPSQMLIRGAQFQIIEGDFTWQEAKSDAETRGGQLAVLNTQEKIDAANSYLNTTGSWPYLWIGLTDEIEQDAWKWVNGQNLTDNNWRVGEPSAGDERYAEIISSNSPDGPSWNNEGGHVQQDYLLEIPLDTDGDGLLDSVETNTGIYVSPSDTGTHPNNADTDGDGIIDGRETNTGTFVSLTDTGTDPNSTDSDGDGFTDKFEIDTSYDPTSSDDTPDAYSFIETAVEVNFYGANGGTYRIEHTEDLESDIWVTVENDIEGSSELIERLYSTDDYSRRFFRAIRTDQ